MGKLLILLAALAVIAVTGMAGAKSSWYGQGANPNFAHDVTVGGNISIGGDLNNSGNALVAGDLSVTGSISAGGGTIARGVFGQDLAMGAGYDFTVTAGDTAFDWSLGTGNYKTTTGAVTLGGGTNIVTLNGPVLGIDGVGWTMVGASMFTLGSTGMMADGGTITFLNGTSGTAGTFSGTVAAEQLTSTDDATINDDILVLGKADVSETMTAEHLVSTDDGVIADDFDVVDILTAGRVASDAGVAGIDADFTTMDATGAIKVGGLATVATFKANSTATFAGDIDGADAHLSAAVKAGGTITGANIVSNASVSGVTLTASGDLDSNKAHVAGEIKAGGTITGANVASNASVSGVTLTASGDADVNKAHVAGEVKAGGTITGQAVASNTSVSGVTLTASGDLDSNKAHVAGEVKAGGTITGANVVSNASVSGVTLTASGDMDSNKAHVAGEMKAGGTITGANIASNASVSGVTLTASGDVDTLNVHATGTGLFGTQLTGQAITSNSSVSAVTLTASGDADVNKAHVTGELKAGAASLIKSLGINDTDGLTVNNVKVPQEIPVTFHYDASSVDTHIFTATGAYQITAIRLLPRVVGSDMGAVTASVMICDDTEAPSAGAAAQTAAFDMKGAADTIQAATLSGGITLAAADSISVDFTGVLTAAEGEITIMVKRV